MEQKRCISSLTLAELSAELKALGQPGFRAKQIFHWVHQKLVTEFSAMTDQPKTLLAKLEEAFYIAAPQIERRRRAVDGRGVALFAQRRQPLAQRLAFRLAEGLRTLTLNIETIFQRPEQPGEDGNHHHVVHRYRQQGLHHKEILRIQALAGEQQLG